MSGNTEALVRPPKRQRLGGVAPLSEYQRRLVSDDLAAASDALVDAQRKLDAARAELRAAEAETNAAFKADHAAARTAAEAGESVPDPTVIEARRKADDARRNAEAWESLCIDRQTDFTGLLADRHVEIAEAAQRQLEAIGGQEIADELEARLLERAESQALLRELRGAPGAFRGRVVSFNPTVGKNPLRRLGVDQLVADLRAALS